MRVLLRHSGLFVALLTVVLFCTPIFVKVASAAPSLSLTGTSTVVFDTDLDMTQDRGSGFGLFFYKGEWPDGVSLGGVSGIGGIPVSSVFQAVGCTVAGSVATCPDFASGFYTAYGAGDFWFSLYMPNYGLGSTTEVYRSLTVTATSVTAYVVNTAESYDTRFVSYLLNPVPVIATNTTSFGISVRHFVDEQEVDSDNPLFFPSLVRFCVVKAPATTETCYSKNTTSLNGFSTTTVSTTLSQLSADIDGTYDFLVRFWNNSATFDSSLAPFTRTNIQGQFTVVGGVVVSQSVDPIYDGQQPLDTSSVLPCSFSQINNCFYNFGNFLFVPSEYQINSFLEIATTVKSKFPFAYAYDFYEVSSVLYNSSTTQNVALTLPFGDLGSTTIISTAQLEAVPFASSLRTLIGALLWLMFGFLVYRRTMLIFNRV